MKFISVLQNLFTTLSSKMFRSRSAWKSMKYRFTFVELFCTFWKSGPIESIIEIVGGMSFQWCRVFFFILSSWNWQFEMCIIYVYTVVWKWYGIFFSKNFTVIYTSNNCAELVNSENFPYCYTHLILITFQYEIIGFYTFFNQNKQPLSFDTF